LIAAPRTTADGIANSIALPRKKAFDQPPISERKNLKVRHPPTSGIYLKSDEMLKPSGNSSFSKIAEVAIVVKRSSLKISHQ
jgi:hypothetical protein